MRSLLLFTGSVIYLVVMIIISPLLLLVYSGLEAIKLAVYLNLNRNIFTRPFAGINLTHFRVPVKEQVHSLWTKAMRFHL